MNAYQTYALTHYLTDYPENKDFNDVLDMIREESEEIVVWSVYENENRNDLTDYISHMVADLQDKFIHIKETACIIERETIKEMFHNKLDRFPCDDELDKICEFIEHDFTYQLSEKVSDAITYCNIPVDQS